MRAVFHYALQSTALMGRAVRLAQGRNVKRSRTIDDELPHTAPYVECDYNMVTECPRPCTCAVVNSPPQRPIGNRITFNVAGHYRLPATTWARPGVGGAFHRHSTPARAVRHGSGAWLTALTGQRSSRPTFELVCPG
jgi:hypothetical protein